MRTKTEWRRWVAASWLLAGGIVTATAADQAPLVPPKPLDDPLALKAAFAARITRPAHILRLSIGAHYADALVQDDASKDLDRYQAVPGQPVAAGEAQKAGSVDCYKAIAFADLNLGTGVRLLDQAKAIAVANHYRVPENVELGSDLFCKQFGWRGILLAPEGGDGMLELSWAVDGSALQARRLGERGWSKVELKALLAGVATAPTVASQAVEVVPAAFAGDGRRRAFLLGIEADISRIEAALGAPLAFKHISIDATQLSVELLQQAKRKRVATYIVDDEGGSIRLWHEADAIAFDCNKPFFRSDIPLARLPAMIASAASLIPPMERGSVKSVHIRRSGICGAPHIYIEVEDDRGYGDVEYDGRGKLVSALVR
jgi:hypothetical protein